MRGEPQFDELSKDGADQQTVLATRPPPHPAFGHLLPGGEKVAEGRMRGWTHCQNGLLIRTVLAEFVELKFTTHGSGLGNASLWW